MSDDGPLDQRSNLRITEDVVAALRIVRPVWVQMMDPALLSLHVRDELDVLEASAREHGYAETGCMTVTHEEGKTTWSVVIAYRWDEDQTAAGVDET